MKNLLLLIGTVFVTGTGWAQAPVYTIATVAGNATSGYAGDGGPATEAQLSNPCKIATDNSGNLFIADQGNARIREVSGGNINTVAGNGTSGYSGDGGAATSANISNPCGAVVDSSGNIYFSQTDIGNSAVREAPASGNMSTIIGTSSTGTSLGAGFSGDGGAAKNAQVDAPTALARDGAGTLYIADSLNNRIRIVDSNGNISTKAGNGIAQYAGDGQLAWRASLNNPQGVAVDAAGNLYIADTRNHCIRIVSGNIMGTFAGTCGPTGSGFSGDGGPANKARLYYPKDVAVDAAGNVFIVDTYNFRIRLVKRDGTIWTIAGRSAPGYSGDGGLATNARLSFPTGIALGPSGTIFISDTQNNVIRVLTPGNITGPIELPPIISGAVSASACGAYTTAAPGAWIEVHGSNLAADTRTWATSDFTGSTAPTMLDGTKVSIAGQSAVLSYISPSQVNAQVPLTVAPGAQNVTVTSPNGTSPAFGITLNAAQPGLCQAVSIGGNPYVATVVNGTSTYVLPASAPVSGISFRPARPGETINFFGNGFGPVNPSPTQGQLVSQADQLATPLLVFFGQTQATVTYAGYAPGFIGLYQINVVVPDIPDSDLVPVTFALGDFAGAPTLYTAVKR